MASNENTGEGPPPSGLTQPGEEDAEAGLLPKDERHGVAEQTTTLTLGCFVCVALSAFLGDASRGLVVPSIVPFIYTTGSDSKFVGWVNGMYSAGRLVAAPLFGYWAEKRSFRESILINLVLFVIGNILYATASSAWMILASRTLVGLGSGTLGLSRGYVALSTTKEDRTYWMAMLTAAQFAGYSITPGLGALMSFLHIDIIGEAVELDMFTTPGYVMALFGLVNAALLLKLWSEPAKDTVTGAPSANNGTRGWRGWIAATFSIAGLGILLYVVLQFMARMSVAVYETMSQLMAVNLYHWGIFTFGMTACGFGIVGLMVLLLEKPVSRHASDNAVLFVGLMAVVVGFIVFTPWGGVDNSQAGVMIAQYAVGSLFIFSIGFPLTQALTLSCFSKLLGPIQQSAIMGWMASLGSLARVLGAVLAGYAFHHNLIVPLFVAVAAALAVPSFTLAIWMRLRARQRRGARVIHTGGREL